MSVRVRLAPSPTGNLHIGTARTALFNWLFAKNEQGNFIIRVEDTDKERSKKEFEENIFDGLRWLGLKWDETPVKQSERISLHQKAISTLLEKGLAYRCYATEKELELMRASQKSSNKPPRYDNRHRHLDPEKEKEFISEGRTAVIRFRIDDNETISWNDLVRGKLVWKGVDLGGDMVIARRSSASEIGDPLYNLAVVIDDSDMNITHVIRGEDHIANTAKQILLYKALDLPIPIFAHTPLILNSEGSKLSKRDGVTSISEFKSMGYTSEAISNYMALLGWSPPEGMGEKFSLKELASIFTFSRVNKAGAKFDWDKLNWLNSQIIHDWSTEYLFNILEPIWEEKGWKVSSREWGISLTKLLQPSLCVLVDAISQGEPFFETPILKEDAIKQLDQTIAKKCLQSILLKLDEIKWNGEDIQTAQELIKYSADSNSAKKGLVMKSLRAALLGQLNGPDLVTTWGLLARIGKDRDRIRSCL